MNARQLLVALAFVCLPLIAGAQQQGDTRQPGSATPQEAQKMQEDGQRAQADRQVTQPANNAPMWRDVRAGERNPYQTTQVRGIETNVLIQNEGQIWRSIRNGPLTIYGGWAIVLTAVAIGLFYWRRGRIMLHQPRTGRTITRFTPWERTIHWATAISFVILAISGMIMLFGKYVVLPLLGYTLFGWLAILSKNAHNFIGPLFVICTLLMIVTYVKDNLWQRGDWTWIRTFGGLFSGKHVPSWRFNAGEKTWFWLGVTFLGILVSGTGLVLDFPNFEQGRGLMQEMTVIHAVVAVAFIAMSLGHIYLGTIGMEGSYDTMRHGTADETWAKEHHEYWYNQVVSNRQRGAALGSEGRPAPASPLKEGWKL